MNTTKAAILLSFIVILGAPFLFRPKTEAAPEDALSLVIITPHIEQLRYEFGRGFSEWHEHHFGRPVVIDWRRPGGTSEIRRQLIAEYAAAVRTGQISPDGDAAPGVMGYDLLFGGGSYEHDQVKRGVTVALEGENGERREVNIPISVPVEFTDVQLEQWFGDNKVGASTIFDPDRYWFGVAMSSFGVVYNRDVLDRLGVPEPRTWEDLTDPRLASWVALADPRQSGSVATSYESILNHYGWDQGWRILRGMAANAHAFSSSSAKVVLDVSRGDAALALSIDFYGRYQSQALLEPGQPPSASRVGYVDPAGAVFIDPDPISLLRGAPHPELARRFIEYLLTIEGQS
ncbi:MAG: extracellular solute-binding protein, partial [Planctomycetota bacterium]|nr:extracellular solute-binding protein [Planctomycetota bacterium]